MLALYVAFAKGSRQVFMYCDSGRMVSTESVIVLAVGPLPLRRGESDLFAPVRFDAEDVCFLGEAIGGSSFLNFLWSISEIETMSAEAVLIS
jgi:hypothetical protein